MTFRYIRVDITKSKTSAKIDISDVYGFKSHPRDTSTHETHL